MDVTIGVVVGDPTGIGPELVARLLEDNVSSPGTKVVVIGNPDVLRKGSDIVGSRVSIPVVHIAAAFDAPVSVLAQPAVDLSRLPMGKATPEAGQFVLHCFELATVLANANRIDGVVYAPICKEALARTGCLDFLSPSKGSVDEFQLLLSRLGGDQLCGELSVVDSLWTVRVTSHLPFAEVPRHLNGENILEAIRLMHKTLRCAGVKQPRIAVCALNPHGGEAGLYGREEMTVIGPAVEAACSEGIAAQGPFPADTVFLRVRKEGFDGVVSMYHDQAQIPMKLLGFNRGVSVASGLRIPVATPSHGTAHDIAGKGLADAGAMREAFSLVRRMVWSRLADTD